MSDPDPEEPGAVLCGGGAGPTDTHLASIIHCVDDEIIEWLARRERPKLAVKSNVKTSNRQPPAAP